MNQIHLLQKLTIASTVVLGVGILAIPQEANAGEANAAVSTEFDLRFDVNGEFLDVSGIFDTGLITGEANAEVDGVMDTDSFGPLLCPNAGNAFAEVILPGLGAAEANSSAMCNGNLILDNDAIAISAPGAFGVQTSSMADSTTAFLGSIIPVEDFNLSIAGTYTWAEILSIDGWNIPEEKSAATSLLGIIELENITTGEEMSLFEFFDFQDLENTNGEITVGDVEIIDLAVPLLAGNEYELFVGSTKTASTSAEQLLVFTPIPEPASIIGLFAVGGLGLGLKRKEQV